MNGSVLLYINYVTAYNKQTKTIFVPGEDCIVFGSTVLLTFGKPYVTLFRLDDTNKEQYSYMCQTDSYTSVTYNTQSSVITHHGVLLFAVIASLNTAPRMPSSRHLSILVRRKANETLWLLMCQP